MAGAEAISALLRTIAEEHSSSATGAAPPGVPQLIKIWNLGQRDQNDALNRGVHLIPAQDGKAGRRWAKTWQRMLEDDEASTVPSEPVAADGR